MAPSSLNSSGFVISFEWVDYQDSGVITEFGKMWGTLICGKPPHFVIGELLEGNQPPAPFCISDFALVAMNLLWRYGLRITRIAQIALQAIYGDSVFPVFEFIAVCFFRQRAFIANGADNG